MKQWTYAMDAAPSLRLLQRRTVWWPTWFGWCVIVAALLAAHPLEFPRWRGHSFHTLERLPAAEVLVVEGWIGREGVRAAATEFREHGYEYLATSGGPTLGRWEKERSNYAEMAGLELVELGVPRDKIIVAPCKDTESRRTFESAAAVLRALAAAHVRPKALNVFTYGPHAKRSRLVYAKVFSPDTDVGVIAWSPSEYGLEPWWRSSQRAKELLSESVGYIFELLLNSGRLTSKTGRQVTWFRPPNQQHSWPRQ